MWSKLIGIILWKNYSIVKFWTLTKSMEEWLGSKVSEVRDQNFTWRYRSSCTRQPPEKAVTFVCVSGTPGEWAVSTWCACARWPWGTYQKISRKTENKGGKDDVHLRKEHRLWNSTCLESWLQYLRTTWNNKLINSPRIFTFKVGIQ